MSNGFCMKMLSEFCDFVYKSFSKIPVYLRGLAIFAIFVLVSIAVNKYNEPEFYYDSNYDRDTYLILNNKETSINNEDKNTDNKKNTAIKGSLNSKTKSAPNVRRDMYSLQKRKKNTSELPRSLRYFWNDNVFGSEDAPITIVEFSSYNCPYCISFQQNVLNKLKYNYIDTGKVRYVKKIIIQKDTLFGVMLPQCISSEDGKYNVIKTLYSNTGKWIKASNQKAALGQLVYEYGFTKDGIDNCFKDEKLANTLIKKQKDELNELRVISTPTLFIDGERQKDLSYEALTKIIDEKYSEYTGK